jgi:endonuclease YncB( thermonuclease family)
MKSLLIASLLIAALSVPTQANNFPCAKSKGGADHCSGENFVCRDGSESASTQKCTPEAVSEFRSQWESDNVSIPLPKLGNQQQTIAAAPLPLVSSTLVGTGARVIDGDTIELKGTTFRLEGIDAPEMKQHCQDAGGKEYACGRRAKEVLAAMIKGPVSCTVSGQDRYGRSLGYCVSGAVDLNKQMVATGWAMAFVKYNHRYLAEETTARSARIGLWAGKEFQPPWDWRSAQIEALQPTGNCIIKGNISKGQKVYYLPFHLMYAKVKVDEGAGEKWFCTEAEAQAAGWIRANR